MECLLLASISSKRRHFHYETSLLCVMWLQQKQLMVLTVLQLLKSKWFFSTNLAPAIWKRRFSLLQALSQLIDPRLQESNDTAVWQFWYHIKPWITSYFQALSRSVIDFQYFSAYQNILTFEKIISILFWSKNEWLPKLKTGWNISAVLELLQTILTLLIGLIRLIWINVKLPKRKWCSYKVGTLLHYLPQHKYAHHVTFTKRILKLYTRI